MVYARMLSLTDICPATQDDEAAVWGHKTPQASHDRMTVAGIGEVVAKCDPDGALIARGKMIPAIANPKPVDTTAAGDSFNAGYMDASLSGQTKADAAAAGNRIAGLVIAQCGAIVRRSEMADLFISENDR
jgi:2-dehydro-3-deoxygluconokinase